MTPFDSFPWPVLPGNPAVPRWTGRNFKLGETTTRLLAYEANSSHWSNALTSLHEIEAGQDHPIDVASRALAVASMRSMCRVRPIILDVGCSSGYVLENLQYALLESSLIGADYLHGPLESLSVRMPEIPILQFDLRKCPLPNGCVDGITCLNVLEHIDDDATALAEIHRILKPGGTAHIEVPSGPSLYDIYDEYLMHHRRYRLSDLKVLAQQTGFSVERATHLGFAVYPAFWWVKHRNRQQLTLPIEEKARLVTSQIRSTRNNPLLAAMIRMETAIGCHVSYPVGIRCVVRLKKRDAS